ncbi:T9SS type A sorting domain-containing protein [Imperialibacter roseus]|uniref:T9SS type A sorting domain-containing protein n=1 Tax=Imperialibacter roseus TaxID=1324217 RepID=A0ABZ0IK17_9BACT|nr:T9SS type A sorting domain-containing protein [Imperialibacter roseus]WOK05353.1 T9SS type A sorting domain-containing protein [Imperialibacter roseus]
MFKNLLTVSLLLFLHLESNSQLLTYQDMEKANEAAFSPSGTYVVTLFGSTAKIYEKNEFYDWVALDSIEGINATSLKVFDEYIIFGSPLDNTDSSGTGTIVQGAGAIFVYNFTNGVVSFHQKITASDRKAQMLFGSDFDLEGSMLAVGAPRITSQNYSDRTEKEAVYVFQLDPVSELFNETAKIANPDSLLSGAATFYLDNQFGANIDITENELYVGASRFNQGQGKIYVYAYDSPTNFTIGSNNILGYGGGVIAYDDALLIYKNASKVNLAKKNLEGAWDITPGVTLPSNVAFTYNDGFISFTDGSYDSLLRYQRNIDDTFSKVSSGYLEYYLSGGSNIRKVVSSGDNAIAFTYNNYEVFFFDNNPCINPKAVELQAKNQTYTTATLKWEVCDPSLIASYEVNIQGIGIFNVAPTQDSLVVDGLTAATVYTWQVTSLDQNDNSLAVSDYSAFITRGDCGAPSYLNESFVSTDSVVLQWTNLLPQETNGFEVSFKGQVYPAATNKITFYGLTLNETITWQVRSNCTSGFVTDWRSSTFKVNNQGCVAPANFIVTDVTLVDGGSQVTASFSWDGVNAKNAVNPYTFELNDDYYSVSTEGQQGIVNQRYVYNLDPGRPYTAKVRANCYNGNSSPWSTRSFNTPGTGCATPANLTVTELPYAYIIDWGDVNTTRKNGSFRVSINGTFQFVNESEITINKSTLFAGTTYTIEVVSVCYNGSFTSAATTSFTTTGTSCVAPTNLMNPEIGDTTATVSWDKTVGGVFKNPVENYELYINNGIGTHLLPPTLNVVSIDSLLAAKGDTLHLSPGTTYDWKVRAKCAVGGTLTAWSNDFFTTTGIGCITPINLVVTSENDTSAVISWDRVNAVKEYQYYMQGKGTFSVVDTFAIVGGLKPGTTYSWKVRASCVTGGSLTDWSLPSTLTTTGTGCIPPTGLNVTGITNTSITISWDSNPAAIGYDYYIPVQGIATTTDTFAIVTGLDPGSTINYAVRSVCLGSSKTGWATGTTNTTGSSLCIAPVGLSYNYANPTSTFGWSPVGAAGAKYQVYIGKIGYTSVISTNSYVTNSIPNGTNGNWCVRTYCPGGVLSGWSVFTPYSSARTVEEIDVFSIMTVEDMIEADEQLLSYQEPEEDAYLDQLTLYPNPAKGHLNIGLSDANEVIRQIKVFEIGGKDISGTLFFTSPTQIDVSEVVNGVYIVRVVTDKRTYIARFIK